MITQIKEYIQFGDFNSKDAGWYLQSRDAPTPDKKGDCGANPLSARCFRLL